MAFLTINKLGRFTGPAVDSTTWAIGTPTGGWISPHNAIPANQVTRWYAIVTADGTPTLTIDAGSDARWQKWTQTNEGTGQCTQAIFYCDTTEAFIVDAAQPTLNIASTASEQYSATIGAFTAAVGMGIAQIGPTSATGNSTNSNPPAITNSTGAAYDFTVICTRGGDGTAIPTVQPTNYTTIGNTASSGTNGVATHAGYRNINIASAGSEDPGVYTVATEQWICFTFAAYEVPVLTGQSVTGTAGLLLVTSALALTGGTLAGSQNSVVPQTSQLVTGQPVSAAQGSASPSVAVALTGQSVSVAQGSVLQGAPLVGQTTAVAQGSSTPPVTLIALTGQSLSLTGGVVAPITTSTLVGQGVISAQGSVLQGAPITGQALLATRGLATASISIGLTGQPLSVAQGQIFQVSETPSVVGQGLAIAQGSPASNTTITLVGQSLTATRGLLGPVVSVTSSGQSLSAAQGQIIQSPPITGQNLVLTQGSANAGITIALIGQNVSVARGTAVPAPSVGAIGQSIATTKGLITASASTSLSGQLVSSSLDLILSGLSSPLTGQLLAAGEGSVSSGAVPTIVTLTGQSVTASRGDLTPTSSLGVLGLPTIISQNSVSPILGSAFTGLSVVVGDGAISLSSSPLVVGQSGFVNQGDIAPSRDVTVALVGISAFIVRSSIGPQAIARLVGLGVHATPGSPFIATSSRTPPGREILEGSGSNRTLSAEADLLAGRQISKTVSGSRALSGSPEGSRDLKGRQSLLADRGKVTD